MSYSVMLDIETLSTAQNAVVLTFGAVKFNPFSSELPDKPIYFRLNVDEQTALGRDISESTLEWWSKQPADIFEEAMSEDDRISLDFATKQINQYLVGCKNIWSQGPLFDIIILENLYYQIGKPAPWQYWQIRDSRTVSDMGDDSAKKNNADTHNALTDSYCQAVAVQQIYKQLGVVAKK